MSALHLVSSAKGVLPMSMGRFLLRRILHSVYVLLGLSIVIFIIARLMPGDPARMAVGARAPQFVVDRIREQMHLNDPIYLQYAYWLRDAVQGDFGLSLVTQRPVITDIKEFLPASLELVFIAGIMAAVGGIGFELQEDVFRRSAALGFWLGEPYWGRGITTAAVKAVTAHAFAAFDLCRLFAHVYERNAASMRVLEKAGYMCEARLRRAATKDGRTFDLYLYSMLKP